MKIARKVSPVVLFVFVFVFLWSCTPNQDVLSEGIDESVPMVLTAISAADSTAHIPLKVVLAKEYTENKDQQKQVSRKNSLSNLILESSVTQRRDLPKTKVSWDPSAGAATSWTANDQLGLFLRRTDAVSDATIDRNNILYAITNTAQTSSLTSTVTPLLYFPYSTATPVTLYGYFPYNASSTNLSNVPYTVPTDQSALSTKQAADILYSRNTNLVKTTPAVTMTFYHAMVLMTFAIKSNASPRALTRVALTGTKITSGGYLDFNAWTLNLNSTAITPFATVNYSLSSTTVYVDLIINYAVIGANSGGLEMTLQLTINGAVHTLAIGTNTTFFLGNRYVYTVNVI